MAKHGFVDHKQTSSIKTPDNGYIRIKADENNRLQYISSSGKVRNISSPWELPVIRDDVTDPSILTPNVYDHHIIPVSAIGDWTGHDTEIAIWNGTSWEFGIPEHGFIVFVQSINSLVAFDGTLWVSASGSDLLATLGDVSFVRTYDDWFMPSKDEMQEIYEQLHLKGVAGFTGTGQYWCSSEGNYSSAWKIAFLTGLWSPGYSKINYYLVIPVREFTSKITYSLRDKGPGGGIIYYKDGNYYQEALPISSNQRWCNPGVANDHVITMLEIGSGKQNTLNIVNVPGITEAGAIWTSGLSYTYTDPYEDDMIIFDGIRWIDIPLGSPGSLSNLNDVSFRNLYDDWYLGELDLMKELMTYIGNNANPNGYYQKYFTSSELSASQVYIIVFNTQTISGAGKDSNGVKVRPVRDFQSPAGIYSVGDIGPAHGTIFYINGTTHYEVSLQDAPSELWSNVLSTLVGTSSALGTGRANSEAIIAQAGHTTSYAEYCLNYLVTTAHDPVEGDILMFNESIQKWVVGQNALEVITASNGLEKNLSDIQLGGVLTRNTHVSGVGTPHDLQLSTNTTSLNLDNTAGTIALEGAIDSPILINSPSGSVSLAIATVDYVDNAQVNADEMTITKQAGFQHRSDGNVLADDVEKYWLFGSVQNSITFRDFIYHDGILYGSGDDWFWKTQSGNTTQFPAGTYEFYASIDLTPYTIYLENTSGPHAYFTSVYENGLYRHTTILASSTLIDAFGIDSAPPHACSIWMIDRFYSGTSDQFSNKNIDLIINSNGVSIDGSAIISTDAKKELVTKDYVDKKTGKADEITLEQITADIIIDTNPDEQLIFNSAWDDAAQTSGWNLSTGITYLNGVMTVPVGTSVPSTGHLKIFDGTTPAICQETYMPFLICSHDQGGAGFLLTIDDDINNKQLRAFDISVLPNGKYKYSFYIPNGFNYSGISIHTGSSPTNVDFEIEFVDMDQYPPQDSIRIKEIDHIIDDDNESIDGSDTPMVDSHRELITRAYFHANSAAITDILYDDLMLAFDSSSLTTGQLYRITDFESLNRLAPDSSDVHSSGVLPLIVQAASIDSIHSFVIDTVNEQDMVNYSFDNKFSIYHSWNMWDFPSYSIVDDDSSIVPTNPPGLDNSIDSNGVEWTLGTEITIDMINLVVTADQGVIPNSDMSWNQSTGILSIVSGSRRFDESHSMMGHTVGHTTISVGVRMVDPYRRFGEITYRKDTINNIEATFDFRNHHYYRYEVDMTGLPFSTPANNIDLLARANTSIAIGSSGTGLPTTSYSLTSNANKVAYPALDLSSGKKYNISLKDVTYTVIEWGDFYNVNMISVKETTIRNVNGPMNQIENTNIYNAETFFMLDGGGIRDTTYHSVRDHLSLDGMIQLCEFTRIDQQTFYQTVQYIKADCTISNLCMNGLFGWCSIKAQGFSNSYFERGCVNLTIEAENIGGFRIQGECAKNTIVTTKSFGIECSGDFKDNTINCGTIANVNATGDFLRNIVSANWNYVNVQNVIDSKIDTHTEMTFSTQITETDDINFSAIATNASKILNSYSMTYVLDTSGGSFDIELPENPSQNTHLIFIDELGTSGTNLVNINQSASPAGGIINTLNGNAVDPLYVLNKDYSYIEMIYTDNGGWILMKESQATLTFDDITIGAPANQLTIKNIDYIIDDTNQSIDGSNTPMANAHTELPTRAYIDTNIANSTNWMKTGTQLEPSDPLVESILIDNNHNGYNIITLENTNTGNGAGGVFEAHKSNTAYQDNIYMGIYSDNFWLTDLAGKGVVFTDQDLVIGTVDNTKNINFLVGNSYTAPVVVGHLNQDGLHLDTIMTTSVHPASYHNLFVDANTGLIYASSTGTTGDSPQTDRVVVNGTMVSNKTFTLTQTYNVDRQIYVYQNGLLLEDVYEWTISSNVITFTEVLTPLTINDRIVIKYYY